MKPNKKNLIFIPDLVSLSVDDPAYYEKFFAPQASLYGFTPRRLPFHFTVRTNKLQQFFDTIYRQTIYRSYTTGRSSENLFWYRRSLLTQQAQFAYNPESATFYAQENRLYGAFFSRIAVGEFFTVQEIISDSIFLQLLRNGYILFPGFAVYSKNYKEAFVAVVPRENGKTTFVSHLLSERKQLQYIADNQILINLRQRSCYPIASFASLNKLNSRKTLSQLEENTDSIYKRKATFKKLYFLINSARDDKSRPAPEDYVLSSLLLTLNNSVMKDFLLFYNLGNEIVGKIDTYMKELGKMEREGLVVSEKVIDYNYATFIK